MSIIIKSMVDAVEKEKVYRFLYDVWTAECRHALPGTNHRDRTVRDDLDAWARHFVAIDENARVVGCMRNNHFADGSPGGALDSQLCISELFTLFEKSTIVFTSRLAVSRELRGRGVARDLAAAGFADAVAAGAEVAICYAAPRLVNRYQRLGYRPYAPSFLTPMGTRIPLVLCCRDLKYLRHIGSSLCAMMPTMVDDEGESAARIGQRFERFESFTKDRTRGAKRRESYHFNTLSNPEAECERLHIQATVAETLEFSKLESIGMQDGFTVADMGAGPGVISSLFAKHFPKSRVIGVEPDERLRQKAAAFVEQKGCHQCTFVEGRAEAVPLDDGSVDFSYARMLFQHISNPGAAVREMRRITRSGGVVAVLDVDDGAIITYPSIRGWDDVQRRVARVQSDSGGNRYIGRALKSCMVNAGFEAVDAEAIPLTTRELGGALFYEIVFGFKRQILERAGSFDDRTRCVFERARRCLENPSTFAMVVTILAYGRVPDRTSAYAYEDRLRRPSRPYDMTAHHAL